MNLELKFRRERIHRIVRVILYVFLMVFSYILMQCVPAPAVVPSLLIPCAVCYAMREDPFSSAVYGMVCGLLTDSAFGMLPGFCGLLFMWFALMSSLLVNNIIRSSFINFVFLDSVAAFIFSLLRYTLYFFIWEYDKGGRILSDIFIPEFIYTVVAGMVLYGVTGIIAARLGTIRIHYIEAKSEDIVRE